MLLSRPLAFAAVTLALLAPLAAQNVLQHIDGISVTSRGTNVTAAKTLLQRLPMDQACGRATLFDLIATIQDQDASTPESFTIEVRTNNPAVPGTPDMSPAGLLGAVGPIPIQFPGAGPSAVLMTVPLNLVTPPFAGGVPAGDLYVAIAFPPAPTWPVDGISLQCEIGALSSALAMNPLAIGYTGAAGVAGLGFESTAGGPAVLATGNRSWALCARFVDDTLQPFVDRPGVPSLTQQFGYVALFPDLARGDRIGWQAHATAAIGDLAGLVVGTPNGGAVTAPLPVTAGLLCLNPALPLITVGIAFYAPIPGGSGLAANWGPFPVSPVFAGAVLFAQAVSLKANGSIALTTSCRTQL
jgi:hypothetical protein